MIPATARRAGRWTERTFTASKPTVRPFFYALSWYRLFNYEGSVSDWYGGCGDFDKDDLYFIDPGRRPTTPS